MSEQLTPKPGEIWLTETSPRSPWATVWNGEKWEWLSDRKVCDFQRRRLVSDGPIGYTAEYVDNLRESLNECNAALNDERQKGRFPGLDDIARDKPWRVLRAADQVLRDNDYASCADNGHLRGIANHLEREATEQRDRLIGYVTPIVRESVEKIANAFMSVGILNAEGVEALVNFDFSEGISAAADALLADKAVDR